MMSVLEVIFFSHYIIVRCYVVTQCNRHTMQQFETPLESMTQTDSLNRSLLRYQRHEAAFARHMEDIQFHTDVGSN